MNEYGFTYAEDNQNTDRFFEQMDFLTPELLRVLQPGRVAAIHVKDRVLFGNATGTGMPTVEPFHSECMESAKGNLPGNRLWEIPRRYQKADF